jgi:hypothetical protein
MAQEQRRRVGCGVGIGIGVFIVLGSAGSLLLMLPLAMSSDPCHQGDPEFRCSATGQALLPWLPWIALVAGLIVAGIGAALVRRWEIAPASGLFGGVVIYVVTASLALGYAGGGGGPQPAPVTRQQIDADYHRLMRRPDAGTMVDRYQALIPAIESHLGPGVQWDSVIDEGPSPCGSDFAAIASLNPDLPTDAEKVDLYVSGTGTLAPAALAPAMAAQGFTEAPDASYHDQYGTTVTLSPVTTAISVDTGCFLSAAAKRRGTPPSGP